MFQLLKKEGDNKFGGRVTPPKVLINRFITRI